MLGLESGVDMQEPIQTLAQQPCAHEQYHRRGNLDHHEVGAKATPQCARRSAAAFRQSSAHIGKRKTKRWCQCEEQCCHCTDARGKRAHAKIQSQIKQIGHPGQNLFGHQHRQ